ncbi:MAG TPA: neutral/alkaline non-lysosomal ceramidase N-terminal domain-containing protein [Verrucomicrobiae bacterium]
MKIIACLILSFSLAITAFSSDYQAGVGRADITPKEPIWLAGYASRNKPSEGIDQKLNVKALALKDAAGALTVIVCADTIGTAREFTDRIAGRLAEKHKLPRERFLFAASHSHNTPVIYGNLKDMYGLEGENLAVVKRYTQFFEDQAVAAAEQALNSLEPVKLKYAEGNAGFAGNRREFGPAGVKFGINATGAVEHSVPVLRIEKPDGSLKSILLGYACHCTTPGQEYKVSGDWAGYAQEYLELTYPGASALFITGCGADANPNPRGSFHYARQHGLALAGSVARVLNEPMKEVKGNITAKLTNVDLPIGTPPGKAYYEVMLTNKAPAVQRYAQRHIGMMERNEPFMKSYPCPVQVFRFGNDLTMISLGGEVVVDYTHRLKRELPQEKLWVSAYCNDVFAYVPSMRILTEGGYEADFNLIYYSIPYRFTPQVEDILVKAIKGMVTETATK